MCNGKAYLYTNLYLVYKPVFNYFRCCWWRDEMYVPWCTSRMFNWDGCRCVVRPSVPPVKTIGPSDVFSLIWWIMVHLVEFSYFEDNSKILNWWNCTWQTLGIKMAFFFLTEPYINVAVKIKAPLYNMALPWYIIYTGLILIKYKIFKVSLSSWSVMLLS